MAGRDIIVIGASAGGVEAVVTIVRELPADLPAAVFIVIHIPPDASSALPTILRRVSRLPVEAAQDGAAIKSGHIYVAVPNHHLQLEAGHMRVVWGPRENRTRPAVDPLFRTAADAYGPRVIGVILSGGLNDGTAGLLVIKRRGGLAVAQDPKTADFPGMPASALDHVDVDYCAPLGKIGPLLAKLASDPIGGDRIPTPFPPTDSAALEEAEMRPNEGSQGNTEGTGAFTGYTCPECGGPMLEAREGHLLRYRCRSGHAFTAEVMLEAQNTEVESTLWAALNTMRESAELSQRIAHQAQVRNRPHAARKFDEQAQEKMRHIEALRKLLAGISHDQLPGEAPDDRAPDVAARGGRSGV